MDTDETDSDQDICMIKDSSKQQKEREDRLWEAREDHVTREKE